jgi:hypothetical protein
MCLRTPESKHQGLRNKPGSLAMFAAILRAAMHVIFMEARADLSEQ